MSTIEYYDDPAVPPKIEIPEIEYYTQSIPKINSVGVAIGNFFCVSVSAWRLSPTLWRIRENWLYFPGGLDQSLYKPLPSAPNSLVGDSHPQSKPDSTP